MNCLPLPFSSAGVPRNTISPVNVSRTAASAMAAPTPDAAIVLWPHPWPSPGSASYSASTPMRGPSAPCPPAIRARIAVASRPAGCSTVNPCPRSTSAIHAAARCSSNAGSGAAWIRWDRSRISSREASTAWAAASLASAKGPAGRASMRLVMALLAFGGERELRDDEDRGEEQQDRELGGVDEPEDHEDGDEQAHPGAPPRGSRPVALVRDPAVPGEHDEPPQRHREQPDREPDDERADVADHRAEVRIPRRDHERDRDPRDGGRGEQRQVEDPVACLHRGESSDRAPPPAVRPRPRGRR